MLPVKLDNTKELAIKLRDLRLKHPVNGEVLTAENLSKAIGNNRAWMSQIESRRLKKIKREDIIKIYKLLYDYDDEFAERYAEKDLKCLYVSPQIDAEKVISSDSKLNDINNLEQAENKNMEKIFVENVLLKQENETLKRKLQSIMEILNM